mmetsp:Transcript_25327/g.86730  ORF Transcript_25327/g.86730 Transcript_25327/m.86730 type:complete len:385 (-) Transcript_25327:158-1312(-)
MANLLTRRDVDHRGHAVLGLVVLLHYLYRLLEVLMDGEAFAGRGVWQALWVVPHAVLSLSGLKLPMPVRRNFGAPVMWPEFRAHSVVFALRHCVATAIACLGLWPQEGTVARALSKACLVLVFVRAADAVTDHIGDREKRTTNSMPYPDPVQEGQRKRVRYEYASAQFAAVAACIGGDASIAFMTMLPIQSAAFLMTLVRKNLITTRAYHGIYSFTFLVCWITTAVRVCYMDSTVITLIMNGIVARYTRNLRLFYKVNKYVAWTGMICFVELAMIPAYKLLRERYPSPSVFLEAVAATQCIGYTAEKLSGFRPLYSAPGGGPLSDTAYGALCVALMSALCWNMYSVVRPQLEEHNVMLPWVASVAWAIKVGIRPRPDITEAERK